MFNLIFSTNRPLEIDSDSSVEEFEDALNADEDIFSEPVAQNRLKYLSKIKSLNDFVNSRFNKFFFPF